MDKRKLGVCVVGAGRAGMIHARNFATSVPGARLVAIADPFPEARQSATDALELDRGYPTYTEALGDPEVDAIVVVTPTDLHREIVVAAASAGKHIFCEKPMAMNAAECEEMIAAVTKHNVKLQIGFMRRFDAGFQTAFRQIADGAIGRVNQVKSLTHGPSVPQRWMLDVGKSNGPLAEVNSHDIDTLRWYAQSEIRELYAIGKNLRCRDQAEAYPDFYDTLLLVCSFENGTQGSIDGAASVGYGYDARVEVLGSDGIIFVGSLNGTTVVRHERGGAMTGDTVPSWRNLFAEAYRNEDIAFVEAVTGDTETAVTGHDGLQAVRVVNAGNESIRTGKPVRL